MNVNEQQMHILRNALGFSANGGPRIYRNRIEVRRGEPGYAECVALADAGLMTQWCGNRGDDLFTVTAPGMMLAEGVA